MVLVFCFFPRKDEEHALRAGYHARDSGGEQTVERGTTPVGATS
jgi:hypothetical protein